MLRGSIIGFCRNLQYATIGDASRMPVVIPEPTHLYGGPAAFEWLRLFAQCKGTPKRWHFEHLGRVRTGPYMGIGCGATKHSQLKSFPSSHQPRIWAQLTLMCDGVRPISLIQAVEVIRPHRVTGDCQILPDVTACLCCNTGAFEEVRRRGRLTYRHLDTSNQVITMP